MTAVPRSTLALHSEVRTDGTLELSLRQVPLAEPGPDQIVVQLEAAPLHPADISQLLGPADLSLGDRTGSGPDTKIVFRIPSERLARAAARIGRSLPVGNEGAGVVVAAGC